MTEASQVEAQLLVDLINTRYLGDQDDILADARAAQWLREHVGGQRPSHTAAALAPLRDLREGLRELALAHNGDKPDGDVIARAEVVLRGAPVVVSLAGPDGDVRLSPTARTGTVEHTIAVVATALLSSRLNGVWPRVKACAEPACRWAFLDRSRNGSKRWCAMSECGNRAKNRAWRAHRSSERG